MRVLSVTVRDFRGYGDTEIGLGDGITVIWGPNGAGKTNLLEALYFGCTGCSCRTSNEREVVRFGAPTTRVVVRAEAEDGLHEFSVGFTPGSPKRFAVDRASVERLLDVAARPLVSVFLPDRLDLVKGSPSLRRAHLDQLVAALWPARVTTRRSYSQTLAQRNALIARIRSGSAGKRSLEPWNQQLGRLGIALMDDRRRAAAMVAGPFEDIAERLGLGDGAEIAYRPRSRSTSASELTDELEARVDTDIERGFTEHGPHRDDLRATREGCDLRSFGSQGQQRVALLSLLLAERHVIASVRDAPPLMLLDDVMSELDLVRRRALVELLRDSAGQAVITTTELEHVPGAEDGDVVRRAVANGAVIHEKALACAAVATDLAQCSPPLKLCATSWRHRRRWRRCSVCGQRWWGRRSPPRLPR